MPVISPNCDAIPGLAAVKGGQLMRSFVARDLAPDHQAERVLVRLGEAQLAERNPELRDPAERVHAGGHVPDRVPRRILFGVIERVEVALHADRLTANSYPVRRSW